MPAPVAGSSGPTGPEIFLDNFSTTLAAVLLAGDQVIALSAALPANAAGTVRALVDSEWVLIGTTPMQGTTIYPVMRNVDPSSALSVAVQHASGAAVQVVMTAQSFGGQTDPAPQFPGLRSLGYGPNQAAQGSALANVQVTKQPLGPVVTVVGAYADGSYVPNAAGGSMSGHDDGPAITAALWQLNYTGGTLMLGPYTYYVNTPPQTIGMGYSSIPFPTFGYTPASMRAIGANLPLDRPVIRIIGVPGLTKIICPRTDAYSASNGPFSVMGSPTKEGTGQTAVFNNVGSLPVRFETEGVTFIGPDQPVGGLLDKGLVSSARTLNCTFLTTSTASYETNGVSPANLPGVASFAYRGPIGTALESRSLVQECLINGYGAFIVCNNHTVIVDVIGNFGRTMIGIDDTCAHNAPAATIHYMFASGTLYWITGWDPSAGVKSLTTTAGSNSAIVFGSIGQVPWIAPFAAVATFLDANNLIAADLRTYAWKDIFNYSSAPNISGGSSAKINSRSMDQSGMVGTATLVAGTVTVTTGAAANAVTTSNVRAGIRTPGGTTGAIAAYCSSAGTVVIKSTSASDTSTVWYDVGNPA